jgi:hypothetical protein
MGKISPLGSAMKPKRGAWRRSGGRGSGEAAVPCPATPPCWKALLGSASGVKGNADDDEHDAEHSNGSD